MPESTPIPSKMLDRVLSKMATGMYLRLFKEWRQSGTGLDLYGWTAGQLEKLVVAHFNENLVPFTVPIEPAAVPDMRHRKCRPATVAPLRRLPPREKAKRASMLRARAKVVARNPEVVAAQGEV
jgi:hypothetical protein